MSWSRSFFRRHCVVARRYRPSGSKISITSSAPVTGGQYKCKLQVQAVLESVDHIDALAEHSSSDAAIVTGLRGDCTWPVGDLRVLLASAKRFYTTESPIQQLCHFKGSEGWFPAAGDCAAPASMPLCTALERPSGYTADPSALVDHDQRDSDALPAQMESLISYSYRQRSRPSRRLAASAM